MSHFSWMLTLLFPACVQTLWAQVEVKEAWVATYDGPAGDHDAARAIAVDREGNVYVTGSSQTGRERQPPFGGGPENDIATLMYDSFGCLVWEARFNGTKTETDDDESSAIAVDASGNVYVTGHTGGGPGSDFVTIKYTPDGVEEWVVLMQGIYGLFDKATALELDGDGFAYVTGSSFAGTGDNIVTLKYDSLGRPLWKADHYANMFSASPRALALGPSRETIVVGSVCDADICECITIKYDPSGTELWARTESRNTSKEGVALAVDIEGNAYLAGFTLPSGKGSHIFTIKINPGGAKLWQSELGGDDDEVSSIPVGIAVDREGNVYVGGQSCAGDTCAFVAVKYDGKGVEKARAAFGDPRKDFNVAEAMAFDSDGGMYLTGKSGSDGGADLLTLKLDRDLNAAWIARLQGGGSGTAIALGADGAVVVAGETSDGMDFLTVKYEQPNSQRFWRGDVNVDGVRNLTDVISLLDALFRGKAPPPCRRSADADDDGTLALTDAIFLLNYIFLGGPAPDADSPGCARDSTPDSLDCVSYGACN